MTNYNERLDEAIERAVAPAWLQQVHKTTNVPSYQLHLHKTKQAITSLYKELVAEAKPARATISDDEMGIDRARKSAANHAIDQFEQNLLKALSKESEGGVNGK